MGHGDAQWRYFECVVEVHRERRLRREIFVDIDDGAGRLDEQLYKFAVGRQPEPFAGLIADVTPADVFGGGCGG